ncbi:hypothetical protein U0070_006908 [Myodes glareolus]|uniref:Uncharacterized protein n=1 Tax=Myodes glareolus TaxID=447135 RepID=A0AAW0I821_MYOGA
MEAKLRIAAIDFPGPVLLIYIKRSVPVNGKGVDGVHSLSQSGVSPAPRDELIRLPPSGPTVIVQRGIRKHEELPHADAEEVSRIFWKMQGGLDTPVVTCAFLVQSDPCEMD